MKLSTVTFALLSLAFGTTAFGAERNQENMQERRAARSALSPSGFTIVQPTMGKATAVQGAREAIGETESSLSARKAK